MAWTEDLDIAAVYAILAITLWIFVARREASVRKLCYFPVVQCRPIQTLQVKATPKAFGLNWKWAFFTDAGEPAEKSEFSFLGDLQPLFHYDDSDFPVAMQLKYGTRSITFELCVPRDPGTSCRVEGLQGCYWPEALQVTDWLEGLFGVSLRLCRIELEDCALIQLACNSNWDTEKQRAHIILDTEELGDTVEIDSVRLRRKRGGYEVEAAGCVQQVSSCWA